MDAIRWVFSNGDAEKIDQQTTDMEEEERTGQSLVWVETQTGESIPLGTQRDGETMRNTQEQLDIITPPFRKLTLYIIQKMRWERDQEEQGVIRVSSLWKNAWRFLQLHPASSRSPG